MTDEPQELFGRPIVGEVDRSYSSTVEQWPDEQFLPLLDAVLDVPGVKSVGWKAYVPGFNDGEPCTFTLREPYVRIKGLSKDFESYEYGDRNVGSSDLGRYEWSGSYLDPNRTRTFTPHKSVDGIPDTVDLEALSAALDSFDRAHPHFENLIQRTFGDNHVVKATKKGFEVEYYDCGY